MFVCESWLRATVYQWLVCSIFTVSLSDVRSVHGETRLSQYPPRTRFQGRVRSKAQVVCKI